MSISKIRLHSPVYGTLPETPPFQPKRIPDLRGKSVVIIDNAWWIWEQTLPRLTEVLAKRYGVARTTVYKVPRAGAPPIDTLEKAAKDGDCAILSLAYGGPELAALLDNAIIVAKKGLPTVCIVADRTLWDRMARGRNVILPVVTIPMEPEGLPVEKAIEMMDAAIDDIIKGLTHPPEPQSKVKPAEPYIEVADSPDEIYEAMYRQGWTDGLPVIPPTDERVRGMIDYVRGDAGETIGELPPFRGVATLGNIAANAVMAGCLPEHVPVLKAMVRACRDVEISLTATLTGAGAAVTPMAIINGPIRNKLDINCSRGLMGPGRRSNAALGRALQFMLRNIGGATLDIAMLDYMSQPANYTFCFGENEEESPWEPLHVERGFPRQASTVTVASVSSIIQSATYTYDLKTILTVLADSLAYCGSHTVIHGEGSVWVFISPEHARQFARQGLSKKDVKEFIWEKARIPVSRFPEKLVAYPHHLLETNGQIRVVNSPDDIKVVVVAGPGRYYGLCMVGGPVPEQIGISTREIK